MPVDASVDAPEPAPPPTRSERLRELIALVGERPPWLGPLLVGLTVALVLTGVSVWRSRQPAPPEALLPRVDAAQVTLTTPEVIVHLSGRVRVPGVYRLRPGDRIVDLIDAAGGSTVDADLDRLNLAAVVFDGDRVHVPARGEELGPPTVSDPTGADTNAPVDLNRADAAELERLHGIGPALAAAIIEDRDRNGPFASIADLERVSGIGPAVVDRIGDDARAG